MGDVVRPYRATAFARSLNASMRGDGPPCFPDWRDGLHPPSRSRAEEVAAGIQLHGSVAARNSSMVFAFNLLLPFTGPDLRLPAPLSGVAWESVELEWTPPGDLLAEIDGDVPRDDERATAIDGVLRGRRDGRRVVALVEVKLSEGGFTPCGGCESRGNRDRAPCRDAGLFLASPERCYLTRPLRKRRDRRYWSIFSAAHGDLARAFPGVSGGGCPFEGDAQQLMRQHALALAIEQEGIADETWLVVLHHDRNPDIAGHVDAYRSLVAEPDRIVCLPASSLLAAEPVEGWADWMRARYLL
jgi:hypothetical protein